MAKIVITLKILFIWLYNGFASILIQSMIKATGTVSPIELYALIWFCLIIIFMPEILFIVWPTYRRWVMQGAEDGDGILHSKDLKGLGILYISLWSMRVFVAFGISIILGNDIPILIFITPLIGSFGTAGLAAIKSVVMRK